MIDFLLLLLDIPKRNAKTPNVTENRIGKLIKYIHTMGCCIASKINGLLLHTTIWMNPENII